MYGRSVQVLLYGIAALVLADVQGASAQGSGTSVTEQPHQHDVSEGAGHDQEMTREGSGTSWLPNATPMHAFHWQRGDWQVMLHENAFLQFLDESGDRGSDQAGSINWVMGMAQRTAGPGRVMLRGMLSAEPWTVGGCGYPDLLASGERCNGEAIHDRQHPHDLMMELSARYDAPLAGSVRWQVYGGPVGEPALGPVAYPHRISAFPNPLAPIGHHWLDSTHVTFGVLTGALYGQRWKSEISVFNGREPDENRADFDLGALDSVSGRVWFLPTAKLALQFSAGQLAQAETTETGEASDLTRVTTSATYHTTVREQGLWATTLAWGRNIESGHGSNAILTETNFTVRDRDSWFARFEAVRKSAHDLAAAESDEAFTVAKVQGGYTRYLTAWRGLKPGVGATLSAGFVPADLSAAYGGRVHVGYGVFLTLRPAAMTMHAGHDAGQSTDYSQHGFPRP
jgi:hypothetical protein